MTAPGDETEEQAADQADEPQADQPGERSDSVAALSDDELRHELAGLKAQQAQVESGATPQQRTEHAGRTELLEAEFLHRFGSG